MEKYLVVFFDQGTDGIGLAGTVGGDQLGDNVDAEVLALARGEGIDLGKPLLGGLIIPLVDVNFGGSTSVVARRCVIQGDGIGVAKNGVVGPAIRIGPSWVSADEA